MGKSSYGPWRNNTPPTENQEKPKKNKGGKLHISLGERRSAEKTKSDDREITNNSD
jgi:hypothetical protein